MKYTKSQYTQRKQTNDLIHWWLKHDKTEIKDIYINQTGGQKHITIGLINVLLIVAAALLINHFHHIIQLNLPAFSSNNI